MQFISIIGFLMLMLTIFTVCSCLCFLQLRGFDPIVCYSSLYSYVDTLHVWGVVLQLLCFTAAVFLYILCSAACFGASDLSVLKRPIKCNRSYL